MNLTAVTDPMEVVTRHFLDCAPLAPYAAARTWSMWAAAQDSQACRWPS